MAEQITTLPSIVRKQAGNRYYCFGTIGSDKVKAMTFVPVLDASDKTYLHEDTTNGYQRPGSPSRMRAFAKFLSDNPNSVVPPILLSARGNWEFVQGEGSDEFGSLNIRGLAAIVDGQHRLGGYVSLFEKDQVVRAIPFVLLESLSVEDEEDEFVVVNNSQKGVARSLTAYLQDSEEAQIAWGLNEDPDSPFYNRIARTKFERTHLFNLHSVAKQMKVLFKHGALESLDVDTKISYASRFLSILSDEHLDEWLDIEKLGDPETKGRKDFAYKLLELTGLIAWTTAGALIFARSYSEAAGGMNWDNVRRLVKAASGIDWRKDGLYQGRTGSAGGTFIAKEIERLLPAEQVNDEG